MPSWRVELNAAVEEGFSDDEDVVARIFERVMQVAREDNVDARS